ncbi:MAG: hypothetical protein KAS67_01695 [Thermoplasmata archaeon]|nr:hypothetical protein [Thermoplasmata archaeon]
MAKCPYCKNQITFDNVRRDVKGAGFLKQEIIYSCPICEAILGFSRGNYS